MAGFLYFLPGLKGIDGKGLAARGLAQVITRPSFCEIGEGPSGGAGIILISPPETDAGKKPRMRYRPKDQEWRKAVQGKYWLGYERKAPPAPEDLARTEQINGHLVRLGDGREWLVPVARMFPEGSCLPEALVLGPKGQVVREPLARYAGLYARCERVWKELAVQIGWEKPPEDFEPLSDETGFGIAVEALSLNYRLGREEISMLRLLTSYAMIAVLEAVVDYPSLVRYANEFASKKNDAPGVSRRPEGGSGGKGGS